MWVCGGKRREGEGEREREGGRKEKKSNDIERSRCEQVPTTPYSAALGGCDMDGSAGVLFLSFFAFLAHGYA